jgi:Fic family protein
VVDKLDRTPFAVPDHRGAEAFEGVRAREMMIRERLGLARWRAKKSVLADGDVGRYQRAREIFESNKIEGLGPDLSRTDEILVAHQDADIHGVLFGQMLEQSRSRDPQLAAVLGLNAAKVMSEEQLLSGCAGRSISSIDLRALHGLICLGESHAGAFRFGGDQIAGSGHGRALPSNADVQLGGLIDWLAEPGHLPPTVIAAVAHGWLSHTRPFTAGNGRLARLLMNRLLIAAKLPPVIVRHDTDRSVYLHALAQSDRGGDIFPLVDVLLHAQDRFAGEINRPEALRAIVRQQIAQPTQTRHTMWLTAFGEFMTELAAALDAHRVQLSILDALTPRAFGQLLDGDPAGSTRIAWLRGPRFDRLLWMGYSSSEINTTLAGSPHYPSLFVSVRSDPYSLHPYRAARAAESGGVREIQVYPGPRTRIYLRTHGSVRWGYNRDSANEIAGMLAAGITHEGHPT